MLIEDATENQDIEMIDEPNELKDIVEEVELEDDEFLTKDGTQLSGTGVWCTNPFKTGYLVNRLSKKCVDPESDGKGKTSANWCNGYPETLVTFCGDGTIRNWATNLCLRPNSNGRLMYDICGLINGPDEDQQFEIINKATHKDFSGTRQWHFHLRNKKSRKCIGVKGSDGSGKIKEESCNSGTKDQMWYIKDRGTLVGEGKLVNKESKMCLQTDRSNGRGRIITQSCSDEKENQYFKFWSNGEITNVLSNRCIDVEGTDGTGEVKMNECMD